MSMFSLLFEGAVAVVLALVAGLCWRLDRRLTALRSGQDGVRQTVGQLAEATARAEASVKALRAAGESAGRDLDEKVARARALADELGFLISSGGGASSSSPAERRGARPASTRPCRSPDETGRADAFAALLDEADPDSDIDGLRRRLKGVR